MSKLKTVEETAAVLGLAPATLNGWRVKGCGPVFTKMGKSVRYSDEAIEAFKDARAAAFYVASCSVNVCPSKKRPGKKPSRFRMLSWRTVRNLRHRI